MHQNLASTSTSVSSDKQPDLAHLTVMNATIPIRSCRAAMTNAKKPAKTKLTDLEDDIVIVILDLLDPISAICLSLTTRRHYKLVTHVYNTTRIRDISRSPRNHVPPRPSSHGFKQMMKRLDVWLGPKWNPCVCCELRFWSQCYSRGRDSDSWTIENLLGPEAVNAHCYETIDDWENERWNAQEEKAEKRRKLLLPARGRLIP